MRERSAVFAYALLEYHMLSRIIFILGSNSLASTASAQNSRLKRKCSRWRHEIAATRGCRPTVQHDSGNPSRHCALWRLPTAEVCCPLDVMRERKISS